MPNMAVFCSSRTSWFPGMLPTYFLNDFEMVPVAPIITGLLLLLLLLSYYIYFVSSVLFLSYSFLHVPYLPYISVFIISQ